VRLVDEPLRGVKVLSPEVYEDSRGFFMESYNRRRFAELGIDCDFVQDNHSRSSLGVLRGLHYQLDRAQAKLVRTTRGSVFDVVVDIRHGSPSFGEWVGIELSEENRLQPSSSLPRDSHTDSWSSARSPSSSTSARISTA